MRCSHNYQQCACTASNAHVRLQAIEYLNISGLVKDFVTSPVRTGNSFFGSSPTLIVGQQTTQNQAESLMLTSVQLFASNFRLRHTKHAYSQ